MWAVGCIFAEMIIREELFGSKLHEFAFITIDAHRDQHRGKIFGSQLEHGAWWIRLCAGRFVGGSRPQGRMPRQSTAKAHRPNRCTRSAADAFSFMRMHACILLYHLTRQLLSTPPAASSSQQEHGARRIRLCAHRFVDASRPRGNMPLQSTAKAHQQHRFTCFAAHAFSFVCMHACILLYPFARQLLSTPPAPSCSACSRKFSTRCRRRGS